MTILLENSNEYIHKIWSLRLIAIFKSIETFRIYRVLCTDHFHSKLLDVRFYFCSDTDQTILTILSHFHY